LVSTSPSQNPTPTPTSLPTPIPVSDPTAVPSIPRKVLEIVAREMFGSRFGHVLRRCGGWRHPLFDVGHASKSIRYIHNGFIPLKESD
jgi:hypothetical protein